tara:strand:+ start:215 stop:406 length:192 start_codon:yes stop_codon:yes gene_type:complete
MISAYFRWIPWKIWERKVKPAEPVPKDFLEKDENKHVVSTKQETKEKEIKDTSESRNRLSIWV